MNKKPVPSILLVKDVMKIVQENYNIRYSQGLNCHNRLFSRLICKTIGLKYGPTDSGESWSRDEWKQFLVLIKESELKEKKEYKDSYAIVKIYVNTMSYVTPL